MLDRGCRWISRKYSGPAASGGAQTPVPRWHWRRLASISPPLSEQEDVSASPLPGLWNGAHEYFAMMKRLEPGVLAPMCEGPGGSSSRRIGTGRRRRSVCRWWCQRSPVSHRRCPFMRGGIFSSLAPSVFLGVVLNLPPLLAGWAAAKKLAGRRGVVSRGRSWWGFPPLWSGRCLL